MKNEGKSDYIGITIGPIVDTLLLSSSPAGLWGASYLFSYIAKNLAEKLIDEGIEEKEFVCPALDQETEQIIKEAQGVGLFHDRIIFRAGTNEMDTVKAAISWIKDKIADEFYADLAGKGRQDEEYEKYRDFMRNYLQIHAVKASVEENDNPILVLGPLLDSLELMKTVNTKEEKNYILKMLVNQEALNQETPEENDESKGKNFYMKSSFLAKDIIRNDSWQLMEDGKIKNISDIAGNTAEKKEKTNKKKYQYYAFVQSDGDNLTKILKSIGDFSEEKNNHDAIREFSKTCFRYSKKAAAAIHEYGGVTIYAGGDDLLFLAPLENEKRSIFQLVQKLEGVFEQEFDKYLIKEDENPLSVSFGVAIHHESYPLYESLKRAFMLLSRAKDGEKNGLVVELMKHSGQKNGIHVLKFSNNETYQQMLRLFDEIWQLDDNFLRSLMQKFGLHEKEIKEALLKQEAAPEYENHIVQNLVENLFSNRHHNIFNENDDSEDTSLKEERKYIRDVTGLFFMLEKQKEIQCLNKDRTDSLACLETMIRIMKFYQEERGDA
ncbi:type III-B CRISPR-associated protein Cas10/Cmr2 [Anaerostipes sp.]|uniref:type III-B CRISPR-associated protein Cas10/Cmr2 n=1 Tax=Anaerostipes sp. TaxID=1872530 RepID=UPI0025BC2B4F|nr:type III-B CRISPR-associated protein Cas10/Cmr2 [Anaerostipes sp.]MBS7007940.1 type III-B CRISPR-associated protein Cas10/Cmr2 [Anaerostipes sp.]